jgi:hypothetical protein
MTRDNLAFVSFEPDNERFVPFVSIDQFLSGRRDPELTLKKAADAYRRAIAVMRSLVMEIHDYRMKHKLLPAQSVWELGNSVFVLINELEELSLQLDGVYDHLVRDLGVKRKWLEKVIILRRYVPRKDLIPKSLNWGQCEKGTRRKAERIAKGLPVV